MKTLHIGHHFFGAGNFGDDLMLAGFLAAAPAAAEVALTCCVPHPKEPLRRRFPRIEWLDYDEGTRRQAVERCDAWIGVGGAPFQCAVSGWFVEHLAGELRFCSEAGKPMFLLGVGGQDAAAYDLPPIRALLERVEGIWTRDPETAERAARAGGGGRVWAAADLAHLVLSKRPAPIAASRRLTVVLNFDYVSPRSLEGLVKGLEDLPASERIWLAQESRALPGAERALFEQLPDSCRRFWREQTADDGLGRVADALGRWPDAEWLVSSRYHAALVGAWAGSKGLVLRTNDKLAGVARLCGWPVVGPDEIGHDLARRLTVSQPVARAILEREAASAATACAECFQLI